MSLPKVLPMSLPAATPSPLPTRSSRGEGEKDSGKLYQSQPGSAPFPATALIVLAAMSGLLTLVLQTTQGRMFAQIHENSIYSFSVVLALFLAGLAGGAALARECCRRGASRILPLKISWIMGGLAVFASPHLFYALTDGLSYLKGDGGWASYGTRLVWLGVPTVLLPALLSGMVLPVLMDLAGACSATSAGRVLGRLLAANTAGAIAGALLGAFACPRWLGLWGRAHISF